MENSDREEKIKISCESHAEAESHTYSHTEGEVHSHSHTESVTHTHSHTENETHTHSHSHAEGETHAHSHAESEAHTQSHDGVPHSHAHNHPNQKAVSNRLARAIGHLEAVKRMVDNGEDCAEILIQLAAVRNAINNAGKVLLSDHINHCIVEAVEEGDMDKIAELNEAIKKFL